MPPWTGKQKRLAQAVKHGFKPTGAAKGFTKSFATQVIDESKRMPTKKKKAAKKGTLGDYIG